MADPPPFHLQPVLTDLYYSPDLLDFDSPVAAPSALATPPPAAPPAAATSSPSLFASATSIAAAARRAAAAVSPSAAPAPTFADAPAPPPAAGSHVTAVEGYGNNLYVGGSDGAVEWWTIEPGAERDGWTMRHRHSVFPKRPVSRLVLLPKVGKAFILSESTLHPVSLPGLEPLPSSAIPPMRGVASVVLNDDELDWSGQEERGAEMTVVVVRRKALAIYKVGQRMTAVKEIPLPAPPTYPALFATYLCAAIPSDTGLNYSIIDLSDASLTEVLPVSQVPDGDAAFDVVPNVAVIPGDNEFLVTSYTGAGTIGVFLNGHGDPVRGTVEWPAHPVSLAVEGGFVLALLRDNTVVVHALQDLDKPAQVIQLSFDATALSYSPYGMSVRDVARDERMVTTRMRLLPGPATTAPDADATVAEPLPVPDTDVAPPSGSGLTPPSSPQFGRQPITPNRSSSLLSASVPPPFSTFIAETLVFGPNGVYSLAPTPIVLRLEQLCAARRMDDAARLVDDERRAGRHGHVDVDRATHAATLRWLNLYLAAHLFAETVFERAGEYFLRGKIDPRLVVRLFPAYRGKTIGSDEEVEVFEGLREVLEAMTTVDDIISTSIRRNYSPHVRPDTATAPETTSLRLALEDGARGMLADYLRKTRISRRKGGGARGLDSRKIDIVIDTTLAKLLADADVGAGTTAELLALLAGPNDVVLAELEPFLDRRKYVLATVMRQQGRTGRVLELLKEIAENAEPDPLCADPVAELAIELEAVTDPALLKPYALWLARRDPERALSILYARGRVIDDAKLVAALDGISPDAADRYLEHIVVDRHSSVRALHEKLLDKLMNAALEQVTDDGVKYHLEELDAEYRLAADSRPYPVFLADVAPPTPIKTLRLKLILFLQGSPFVDLGKVLQQLEGVDELAMERAIVLGRLGRHRPALAVLARDLADATSAQTYCTQNGELIPPKVARQVAAHVPELSAWAALGDVGRLGRRPVAPDEQKELVMELLRAYMGEGQRARTAGVLDAQSVHLDVGEVLPLVPDDWPVNVISTFYQRSLRRALHTQATWSILKSVAAGENLETSAAYLDAVRAVPPIVQRVPGGGIGAAADEDDEAHAVDEKGEGGSEGKLSVSFETDEGSIAEANCEKRTGFFEGDEVRRELENLRREGQGR
ncbi:hypothetical protein Q5752_003520 [Cryptotrichosporon argae]